MSVEPGVLYVVATPIGNLGDLSPRALEVLGGVTLVAAEDTRRTGALMREFGVVTPLRSLHEHNEAARAPELLERLAAGDAVALVSDAGTPLVSDPGYLLIDGAHRRGIPVLPVPGPSAVTALLSVAGLPVARFAFEGFLPQRPGPRRERLEAVAAEPRTLVFYESPHRIGVLLGELVETFGATRLGAVGRELTKRFEEVCRAPLGELREHFAGEARAPKGEYVVAVAGDPNGAGAGLGVDGERLLRTLIEELPVKQAAAIAARVTGESRNALYRRALDLQGTGNTS